MGVPKFFRYISERYPCLSELAREHCIPEFDNLYLDMNGIIHNCSHPDDTNIHFNITEEEIFKDIFNYIDKLFFLIKPQKLFFMAIDGVAPRAKMNQQRSRRFRSAKEADILEKLANSRGEIREHERFDSNCITPGTEFMVRLHEALRYFIKSKISNDQRWQKCRVILSGHDFPGEGEHKIMDYIRYLKLQSNFNPNTRHCLYGLDADLIILGLCTHELHFVVLREEVKFGRKNKKVSVEETRFFLLHLGLLREYLELEFDEIKRQDPNFNIAKLIDDWILMGFLVGNDFIPHLPCLHISSNALPLLYKTYKNIYSNLEGNINENGKLNLGRLEKYFEALAKVEFEIFQENHADLKYFQTRQINDNINEAFDFEVGEAINENSDNELTALIESSSQFLKDNDKDVLKSDEHITDEFLNYKRIYYMNKFNKDNSNSEYKKENAIGYVTALQWILDYYYRGVQSWSWYYPHHYAPFISDLKDFKDYEIKFSMGNPFLPFQQLLAVLPSASKNLLPRAYRDLMTSATSELIHYYPEDFKTDLNGKQHEWEAVVLIPFIDEKILLDAMTTCDQNLTPSEYKRNKHGPMLQYDYHPESQGQVSGIYSFKALHHVFCTETPFWPHDITLSHQNTVCIAQPYAARSVYFPGFPTMKHLSYRFEIKYSRVKVFDYPSRNNTMILQPDKRINMDDIFTVAEKYLNHVVFIGWPHLTKAKVVGISNNEKYIDVDGTKEMEPKIFEYHVNAAQEHFSTRMGIEFPDFCVMVHVRTYIGSLYECGSQGKVTCSEVWSQSTTAYPAQGVVSQIAIYNSLTHQHTKIEQLFPEYSRIFFVGNPYFGSEGVVMNPMLVYECGRLKVNITVLPEPDFSEAKYIQNQLENDYVSSYQAAIQLGVNIRILARITGSVLVVKGARRTKSELSDNFPKLNVGLQFKFTRQQELSGYARRIDNQWFLSTKAIALVQLYIERFPVVARYLSRASDRADLIFEQDIFPLDVGENKIEEIVAWLKEQDYMKAEKVTCGSKTMEKESILKVLDAIEQLKSLPVKTVKLQVKPHLLLRPDDNLRNVYKPKRQIEFFDRVVVVKTTYIVPLGSKGTVVGIYPVSDPNPVRLECVKVVDNFFEILFDKHILNANDIHGIATQRVYKLPESSILLIYTQDYISQNNNFDSKMSSNIGIDKNMSTTSTLKQAEVTVTTNTESDVTKSDKNSIVKQMQDVHKEANEFWMPVVNTKHKYANTIKIMQNPLNNSNKQHHTTENIEPEECNDGTQILKTLLGLPGNQLQPVTRPAIAAKPQLPQPPTSWRTDAQKIPTNWRVDAQTMPAINFNYSGMHLSQYSYSMPFNSPIGQQQLHIKLQQESQPIHFQQLPQQNLKMKTTHEKISCLNRLNQKGAFIPLQVSRVNSNFSTSTTTLLHNLNNSISNNNKEIMQNLNELQLRGGSDGNNVNQQIENKPTYRRKKPPRIPKIGAKFDKGQ